MHPVMISTVINADCVPPDVAIYESTFSPHIVFMCSVICSQLSQIFSLNSINLLVFVRETRSVFSEVGTEILSIMYANSYRYYSYGKDEQEKFGNFSRKQYCFGCHEVAGQRVLPPCLTSFEFGFPLSITFHHCSILIFIYMLLLPEGQASKTGNTHKGMSFPKQGSSENKIDTVKPITFPLSSPIYQYLSVTILDISTFRSPTYLAKRV